MPVPLAVQSAYVLAGLQYCVLADSYEHAAAFPFDQDVSLSALESSIAVWDVHDGIGLRTCF
ncbi:hypothetical protein E4U49_002547 [Claviceps purpurea]|nr:hypothetical protein E4U49_002547 [Claviceps purpurea]